jgi:hypothetical protein
MFILELFIQITNEKLIDSMVKVATKSDDNSILPIQNFFSNKSDLDFNLDELPTQIFEKLNLSKISDAKKKKKTSLSDVITYNYHLNPYETINGKFFVPYFCCALDSENMRRIFNASSHILIKEHLITSGLI